jgi:hypothetical protein
LRGGFTSRGGAATAAAPLTEGKQGVDATTAGSSSTAPAGSTWADAVAATSSKANGAAGGGDWGDDTEGLDLKTSAAPTSNANVGDNPSGATDSSEKKSTSTEAAQSQGEPGKVATMLAQIIPSALIPKGSKLSWAQIARPVEPAKPVKPEPQASSVAPAPPIVAPAAPVAERTLAVEKTEVPVTDVAEPNEKESVSVPTEATSTSVLASSETAPLPPALTGSASTTITDPPPATTTAAASKPVLGRAGQSQHAIQRAKQDVPVVMAGNASQYDNLGVKFGSLNFLGGDDNDAETEEVAQLQDPTNASVVAPIPNETTNASEVRRWLFLIVCRACDCS